MYISKSLYSLLALLFFSGGNADHDPEQTIYQLLMKYNCIFLKIPYTNILSYFIL